MRHTKHLLVAGLVLLSLPAFAQTTTQGWLLDQMPADLETDFALSSLPPHLRSDATVYLLDPRKGYYIARKGTNGFSAFVNRTQWEQHEFVQDVYEPISYDAAGSKSFLLLYLDVAAMRATGKYTPSQIKDTIVGRVYREVYKPAPRAGISYMLSPLLRNHLPQGIINQVWPHYMFYAPYLSNSDIGSLGPSDHQPFMGGYGDVLDKEHSFFNLILLAAGETERAKIVEDNKDLLRRLGEYKPFLKVETGMASVQHQH
jgi:hypothetical protein